jgi:hypothetical protein
VALPLRRGGSKDHRWRRGLVIGQRVGSATADVNAGAIVRSAADGGRVPGQEVLCRTTAAPTGQANDACPKLQALQLLAGVSNVNC